MPTRPFVCDPAYTAYWRIPPNGRVLDFIVERAPHTGTKDTPSRENSFLRSSRAARHVHMLASFALTILLGISPQFRRPRYGERHIKTNIGIRRLDFGLVMGQVVVDAMLLSLLVRWYAEVIPDTSLDDEESKFAESLDLNDIVRSIALPGRVHKHVPNHVQIGRPANIVNWHDASARQQVSIWPEWPRGWVVVRFLDWSDLETDRISCDVRIVYRDVCCGWLCARAFGRKG
jgi:hypothetical protein